MITGIRTGTQAREIASGADGVVVGSALIGALADSLDAGGKAGPQSVQAVLEIVQDLSRGLKGEAAAQAL